MSDLLSLDAWRAAFVLAAAAGAIYFGFARRRVDFFTLGFASSVVYFLPGFFGYALRANERAQPYEPDPLDPRVYAIMVTVLLSVLLTAAFYDTLREPAPGRPWAVPPEPALWTLVILGAVAAAMTVLTTGRVLLAATKFEILPYLNRWNVIVQYAAADALVLAVALKSRRGVAAAAALFSLSLLEGARSVSALALIAVAMLVLGGRPPSRFLRAHGKLTVLALPVGLFFFVAPQIFWMAKSGQWSLLREKLTTTETYAAAVRASEPSVIQENLNQIVKSGLKIPAEDLSSLAGVAVPFYTEFWPLPRSFEERFQPELFPDLVKTSLVGNFWAQGWALAGAPGVAAFLALYLAGLWVGSRLLLGGTPLLGSTVAIAFSYFAFYGHRNELAYLLILMRGHALVMLAAVAAAWLFERLRRRPRVEAAG